MSVADIPAAPPATGFARRHAWLAVLVVGAALFIAEERTLVATQNPNLVPSAILLGASIVPLAFVAFVYGRRLPYRVPGIAVAASAFLGGVIGTIVAATLEFDVLRDLGGLPMLGVGLIEETSKLWSLPSVPAPPPRTGIAAAALYAAAATRRRREILQFVGAFVVAVVLHTLWDSQSSLIGTAVVAIASLGLLAFTAHRAARQADPAL